MGTYSWNYMEYNCTGKLFSLYVIGISCLETSTHLIEIYQTNTIMFEVPSAVGNLLPECLPMSQTESHKA